MMKDLLEKMFNLGLGTLAVTREKVEKIAEELVKKGEMRREESKKFIQELVEKGEKSKKEIGVQLEKMVRNILEKLNLPNRKELEKLQAQIDRLKEKLEKRKG